jgi:alkylation response protein AidB-like acyl-CoA dehydrogenase
MDVVAVAQELSRRFAATAAERERGGESATGERQLIRESGLLLLRVPQSYGGLGASWAETLQAVRAVARADSSLAHIFSWHQLEVVTPALIGTAAQAERYYRETAEQGWFWGSALNPLDPRVTATRDGRTLCISGTKSFCTGARGSDMLLVGAVEPGTPGVLAMAIPTRRAGTTVNDDWDNMGQRQSDSGSVSFADVAVDEDEVIGRVRVAPTPRLALRTCLSQLMLANMFVGIAEGSLEDAKQYTLTQTRPWPGTEVARAADEPMILHHYGELWTHLRAAALLADDAALRFEEAWAPLENLGDPDPEAVKACLIAVDAAKVLSTQVGLDVTARMFEVMGARATAGRFNYDRHWRNLRTLTLHDPVEMRLRELGNWYVNGVLPVPDVTT